MSGTTQLFDPLSKAATIHPCVCTERSRYRQSVCPRRLILWSHTPKSLRSEFAKSPTIKRCDIFVCSVSEEVSGSPIGSLSVKMGL